MYKVQSDSGPLCAEKILPVEEPSNEQKDDKVSGVARFTEATDFQRVASLIASHSFSSSLSFHLPDVAKRSMDVAITVMQTSVVTLGHWGSALACPFLSLPGSPLTPNAVLLLRNTRSGSDPTSLMRYASQRWFMVIRRLHVALFDLRRKCWG